MSAWKRDAYVTATMGLYQGPHEPGDGPWELIPCSRCGKLTGHSPVLCTECRLTDDVEHKLLVGSRPGDAVAVFMPVLPGVPVVTFPSFAGPPTGIIQTGLFSASIDDVTAHIK